MTIAQEICGSIALAARAIDLLAQPQPCADDLRRAISLLDELATHEPFGAIVANAAPTPSSADDYYVAKYGCDPHCATAISELSVAVRTQGDSAYRIFLQTARAHVEFALRQADRAQPKDARAA